MIGHCKICNKKLSTKYSKYCRTHFHQKYRGKNHPSWKGGLPTCEICGKILSRYGCKRCEKCMNIGRKLSKKTKLKISKKLLYNKNAFKNKKPNCQICGEKVSTWVKKTKWCLKCFHIYIRGKIHWNYRTGQSKLPYPFEFTQQLKAKIRKRDNYTCQKCGIKEKNYYKKVKQQLAIHHIDYNKFNLHSKNLISLCKNCNSEVNFNRDYWYVYFTYILT
jgi:hypothetical protein